MKKVFTHCIDDNPTFPAQAFWGQVARDSNATRGRYKTRHKIGRRSTRVLCRARLAFYVSATREKNYDVITEMLPPIANPPFLAPLAFLLSLFTRIRTKSLFIIIFTLSHYLKSNI